MNYHELHEKTMLEVDRELKRLCEGEGASPKVAYHYTDACGIEGIIQTRKIWATHALHLNDPQEMKYGWTLFREVLLDLKKASTAEKAEFLERCLENLISQTRFHETLPASYFVSFSSKPDDISQYRAYSNGGAGYCIGFDVGKLLKTLSIYQHAGADLFEFIPVVYETSIQRRCLDAILEIYWSMLEKISNGKDRFHSISLDCIHAAMSLACRFKRPSFEPEKEWRLVPDPFGSPHAIPIDNLLRTRIRTGYFVPYLDVPVQDGNDESTFALSEIYIGPKLDHALAEIGLRKYLYVAAKLDVNYWPDIKTSTFDLQ